MSYKKRLKHILGNISLRSDEACRGIILDQRVSHATVDSVCPSHVSQYPDTIYLKYPRYLQSAYPTKLLTHVCQYPPTGKYWPESINKTILDNGPISITQYWLINIKMPNNIVQRGFLRISSDLRSTN